MLEPMDALAFDASPQQNFRGMSEKEEKEFTFPCTQFYEEDEEVTELKIKDFLDEKVVNGFVMLFYHSLGTFFINL